MRNSKWALCLFSSFFLTTSSQAAWKGNWLVGASGGIHRHVGDYAMNLAYHTPIFPLSLFPTAVKQNARHIGLAWELLAGYQIHCQGWLFGAEVAAFGDETKRASEFPFSDIFRFLSFETTQRYKRDPGVSLSGRFGYAMSPYFLGYLRLGGETNREELTTTITGQPTFPFSATATVAEQVYRAFVGVGAEFPAFCNRLNFRIEYNAYWPTHDLETNISIADGILNPTFISDTHPKLHTLKGSIVWNIQ